MNSIAFFNAQKKRKRNPLVEFQLKNETTLIFKLKNVTGKTPFDLFDKVGIRQHEIKASQLQAVVDICDKHGYEVIPFPDQVQLALDNTATFPFDESFRGSHLYQCMFDYQKEGVEKVVRDFDGRALIGDEMGLGKTLQAISLAKYYDAKRLIIVCPAYLRYTWKHELEKWIPGIETTVILTGRDKIEGVPFPLIFSYEQAAAKAKELKKMKPDLIICDESHYLKSHKTKRSKALAPLVKSIKRALLLSGTPALNRPIELFSQLNMLYPKIFPKYRQFAERYADGKMSPMGFYDASGISNRHELLWMARKTALIRRVKRDVLTQLPKKIRSEIYVNLSRKEVKPLTPLFARWKDLNARIPGMVPCSDEVKKAAFERKCVITELFRKTSEAKVEVVKKVVAGMVEQGLKFIVFCYHKDLMDEVQSVCPSSMRIDGDTPMKNRQKYVEAFQRGETQVAVLSMLAASTGITLTAASIVLFAELYYVPGVVLQSEDRAHRIGQRNSVDVRFIIAKGSLDEHLFKMLHYKLSTLDTALDGRSDRELKGDKQIDWDGLDV